jgi:two-component system KDP operon response regulator KdpE
MFQHGRDKPRAVQRSMANRPRVLVADPDPGIRRLLRRYFGNAGYTVATAELGQGVFDQVRRSPLDVIILSSEMGDLGGTDLISRVHAMTATPLLVLTPTTGSVTPGAILDAGADDCLDEPFLLEELAARTRRLLHRTGIFLGPRVLMTGLGRLEINSLERSANLAGERLDLTRKEFDLLTVLANADGGTVNHDEILRAVWRGKDNSARQNLRRVVGSLRRKLEPEPEHPNYLVSVRGSGYRLNVQEEPGEIT